MHVLLRGVPAEGAEPGEVDPALAEAVLVDHREDVFNPVVEAHRGRPGNDASLSATFDAAVDAVACALALQSRTAEWNAGLPEPCRPLLRWTVVRQDEAADAAPPCEPGGLAISPSVEAEVEATDRLLPPREGYEADPATPNATVFAPASSTVAHPAETTIGAPEPGMPGIGLQPGGLLNGTYEIEELLASGGMGEVFRGREVHSGGEVAVKVIRLDMVHHPSALSLFQKEALVLRDINHDAIVRYYSFSFDPGLRRHYLVMEFVDGPPLSRVAEGRPMPAAAVALLAQRIASGLQLAHERGIIHRDLSPDNIILPHGDPGRAKIIDFGIARAAQIGGGTVINGGFAGKHSYVSPEHLGLAGGEVTAKSDIYSLGIVLAEACLGRQLDMAGTHVEMIEKRRRVPDLSEVDMRLRGLITRMLDPDPERRPESMAGVAEAARLPVEAPSFPAVQPAEAKPGPVASKPPRPVERWILGGALVSALALGAGLFGYAQLSGALPDPQDRVQPRLQPPPQPQGPSATEPAIAGPFFGSTPKPPTESAQPVRLEHASGATGPALPAPPAAGASPPQSMADYVKTYNGGSCFFLRPIRLTPNSADLDAFAQSKDAFSDLDRAFQSRFNVPPDIVGSRVWSRQCPALDFMRQAAQQGEVSPQLFLKSVRVGRGQPLAGEIRGVGGRAVALLIVGENGGVRDVTGALKPDGSVMTFEFTPAPEAAGPAPELLVAVASPTALPPLGTGPTPADAAFRALLDGAAHDGTSLAADAKLFVVGG